MKMNHNKKESVGGQLEDSQSTSEYFVLENNFIGFFLLCTKSRSLSVSGKCTFSGGFIVSPLGLP